MTEKKPMKKVSFTLTEKTHSQLAEMAEVLGQSRSSLVEEILSLTLTSGILDVLRLLKAEQEKQAKNALVGMGAQLVEKMNCIMDDLQEIENEEG